MYRYFIRPVLFLVNPESIHHFLVFIIKWGFKIPGIGLLVSSCFKLKNPGLERKVFGLTFKNPVGFAAGFDKNAEIYNEFASFGFSFIEIGTVTPKPQAGNPRPRLFRIPEDQALINRMGFNNIGVVEAAHNLRKKKHKVIIGGNIGKNTATPNSAAVNDYLFCFEQLYEVVDYFVVNVSCPNVTDLTELQDKDMLLSILEALMESRNKFSVQKPVLLKISPDLNWSQIDDVIEIVTRCGLDGIVATNTTILREGLTVDMAHIDAIGRGGMSGAPLRNRSTEIIRYIVQKTGRSLPVIGVGGIMSVADALEKLEAGASLVQVYTGFIYQGPSFIKEINKAVLKNRV